MPTLRVAELETLFTANVDQVEQAERAVKATGDRIEKNPIKAKVTADAKDALAGMTRVETAAKKLVSQNTALKLDADISRAEKGLERTKQRLADLEVRALGGLDVTADTRRAEAVLSKFERSLDGLRKAKNEIEVEADTSSADSRLSRFFARFRSDAEQAGSEGGRSFSSGLDGATRGAGEKVGDVVGGEIEDTLVSALTAIPIAGGIIIAGVAIGKAITGAIQDGLAQEVGFDRLQGLTGISEADALRLGRVAGEAYTRNFGESVEANMDTTRLALQFDLIDEKSTSRSAQIVVQNLAGISDVLDEDVTRSATAVTTLLRSGLAKTSQEAFDILAAGAREGLNRNEDLLDTLTEYPVVLARLGLSSKDTLGLLNQGLEAGARNTDIVADALKEFQIRSTDASVMSAQGYKLIGLNAEEMTAKIAAGGAGAREGLDQVLDGLRNMEDPVARNAAAVALFGTKAEDLGGALFNLNLDTAAAQFDDLQGSAQRMFDTLSDNDASKIESAQRNIEVAADGIKGALAAAFEEPLGDLADFVSQNRGPVLDFFKGMVDGAFDFGIAMTLSAADATDSFGDFVSGPGADVIDLLINIQKQLNPFADTSQLEGIRDDMRGFKDDTDAASAAIRDGVPILEGYKDKFDTFADGAIAMGYLNDASLRLADSLNQVGYGADGALFSLDGIDLANLRASDSGKLLEDQVRNSIAALGDEVDAAATAGEGQADLADRYSAGTSALADQLVQMGLTQEQAQALIDTVLQTPTSATTDFGSNAADQQAKVQALADRIVTLPDGTVVIEADTGPAEAAMGDFYRSLNGATIAVNVANTRNFADGGVVEFMAGGGLRGRGLSPMQHVAQVVPPSTWRVVGDRGDVPESFIPIDGSARSMSILLETMRRMGVTPMAEGGIAGGDGDRSPVSMTFYVTVAPGEDAQVWARGLGREIANQLAGR